MDLYVEEKWVDKDDLPEVLKPKGDTPIEKHNWNQSTRLYLFQLWLEGFNKDLINNNSDIVKMLEEILSEIDLVSESKNAIEYKILHDITLKHKEVAEKILELAEEIDLNEEQLEIKKTLIRDIEAINRNLEITSNAMVKVEQYKVENNL